MDGLAVRADADLVVLVVEREGGVQGPAEAVHSHAHVLAVEGEAQGS